MHQYRNILVALLCLLPALTLTAGGKWQRWDHCKLLNSKYMDGDSFHVQRTPRSTYIIRLYFVDCPESDKRYPARIKEQAEYFGITPEETLRIGKKATEFTKRALKNGFTVHTRKEKSFGASKKPRYYGFIEYDNHFLAETLVSNGLARIHGIQRDRPDGTKISRVYSRLKKLQKNARQNGRGAWKYNLARDRKSRVLQPPFEPGTIITTQRRIPVYTAGKPYKFKGLLCAGAKITLIETTDGRHITVSFDVDGKPVTAVCLRRDLNLKYSLNPRQTSPVGEQD
jgi:endonuclease YncB( thermonuclease family)